MAGGKAAKGYGISGGKGFIWVTLPFVSEDGQLDMDWWWGDPDRTADYAQATIEKICRDWGGNPEAVILTGHSRGAIACNYIGLRNDKIAKLWAGMVPVSHYDNRGWKQTDTNLRVERLLRLGSTPQYICGEMQLAEKHKESRLIEMVRDGKFNRIETAARELNLISILERENIREFVTKNHPDGNYTFDTFPWVNHYGDWILRDTPTRAKLRKWVNELLGETTVLYNGIELPEEWPPRNIEMNSREPMPVPYLKDPPKVIPINVGRQLFVDDFLIESSTLSRRWHRPVKYEGNPVLKPELEHEGSRTTLKCSPVIYDPADNLFKVWYMANTTHRDRCLAVSEDGIHWQRPELDIVPGTNIVLTNFKGNTNGFDVELDYNAGDPDQRFKGILYNKNLLQNVFYTSPDGVHWKEIGKAPKYIHNMPEFRDREIGSAGNRFHPGDVCTFHWNPFRRIWVFDVKEHHTPGRGRARFYREAKTFAELPDINPENLVFSMGADRLDKFYPGIDMSSKLHGYMKVTPQMYQRDAVAYESLMLGTFSLWYNQFDKWKKIPKINQIFVGFSRDGFHWDRANRDPFIPIERDKGVGNPDFGYLRPAGGGCVVVEDKLYFYYEGTSGQTREGVKSRNETMTINLAILRRDGFASMESRNKVATLETRPVTFSGRHLFVNLDAPKGELKAEVLNVDGVPIEPFTLENFIPVSGDNTKITLGWKGVSDLSSISETPVRFRFHLRNGALYSFWVSARRSGESSGYLASGGGGVSRGTGCPMNKGSAANDLGTCVIIT